MRKNLDNNKLINNKGKIHDVTLTIQSAFILLVILMLGFAWVYLSLSYIRIFEVGSDLFFVEKIAPLGYWIGFGVVIATTLYLTRFLNNKIFRTLFVFSCAILMISLRIVFPIVSPSPSFYEPDTANYINTLNSWVRSGIYFGQEGMYQHDYPMAFLIAYSFIKLGVPIDTFFRWAQSFIYAIGAFLLYLLFTEIDPSDKKCGAISVFLFSISPNPYWLSQHYCPNIVATMFFILSLYLSIRLAKKGWHVKTVIPVFVTISILILSHHMNIMYLALTLLGLSLFTRIFKVPELKGKETTFLGLGVFTYTAWFIYGTFQYPSFFNAYSWVSWTWSTPGGHLVAMNSFDLIMFLIYPISILLLYSYRILKLSNFRLKRLRASFQALGMSSLYSLGFAPIGFVVLLGFIIPSLMAPRTLEVLLIGIYPISSQVLTKMYYANPSKKKKLLVICILVFLTIISVYRYNRVIQRRLLYA